MILDRLRALAGRVLALVLATVAPAQAQFSPEAIVEFSRAFVELQGGTLTWDEQREDDGDIVLTGVVVEFPTEDGTLRAGSEEIRVVDSGGGTVAIIAPHALTLTGELPEGSKLHAEIGLENSKFLFSQDGIMTLDAGLSGLSVESVVRSRSGQILVSHDFDLAGGGVDSVLEFGPGGDLSVTASWDFSSLSGDYSAGPDTATGYRQNDVRGEFDLSFSGSGDDKAPIDVVVDNFVISSSGSIVDLSTSRDEDPVSVTTEVGPGSLKLQSGPDSMLAELAIGPIAVTVDDGSPEPAIGSVNDVQFSVTGKDDPASDMTEIRLTFSHDDFEVQNADVSGGLEILVFLLAGPDRTNLDYSMSMPDGWFDFETGDADLETPGMLEIVINSLEIETSLFTVSAEGDLQATRSLAGWLFPTGAISVRTTGLVTLHELLTSAGSSILPEAIDENKNLVPVLSVLRLFGRKGEDGSLNFIVESDGEDLKVNGVKF